MSLSKFSDKNLDKLNTRELLITLGELQSIHSNSYVLPCNTAIYDYDEDGEEIVDFYLEKWYCDSHKAQQIAVKEVERIKEEIHFYPVSFEDIGKKVELPEMDFIGEFEGD